MAEPLIVGDIGGTNARLALAESGRIEHLRAFQTTDVRTHFSEAFRAYNQELEALGVKPPKRAALAVAGPVAGDRVTLTNQAWTFSRSTMATELGLDQLIVLNDFDATARGIPYLAPADRMAIGGGVAGAEADGPIGIIGPGTGLGVAGLIPVADGWCAVPGEGGHVTMSPATSEDNQVLEVLRQRWDHVSAERVISGQGLVNLYEALCQLQGAAPRPGITPREVGSADPSADPICGRAFDLFCAMLGTVAGNLALTLGASGGVYIVGGILPRFPERFRDSGFRQRFEQKGRLTEYLRRIPTYLVLHPQPTMLGLANLGRSRGMPA